MTVVNEPAAVRTREDGVPVGVEWRGDVYRVSDVPTVWTEPYTWWRALAGTEFGYGTRPSTIGGWRFQATRSETGDALVFDVRDAGLSERGWVVVRIWH